MSHSHGEDDCCSEDHGSVGQSRLESYVFSKDRLFLNNLLYKMLGSSTRGDAIMYFGSCLIVKLKCKKYNESNRFREKCIVRKTAEIFRFCHNFYTPQLYALMLHPSLKHTCNVS